MLVKMNKRNQGKTFSEYQVRIKYIFFFFFQNCTSHKLNQTAKDHLLLQDPMKEKILCTVNTNIGTPEKVVLSYRELSFQLHFI